MGAEPRTLWGPHLHPVPFTAAYKCDQPDPWAEQCSAPSPKCKTRHRDLEKEGISHTKVSPDRPGVRVNTC